MGPGKSDDFDGDAGATMGPWPDFHGLRRVHCEAAVGMRAEWEEVGDREAADNEERDGFEGGSGAGVDQGEE